MQTELQPYAAQAAAAESIQALTLAQHREHRFDHRLALREHRRACGCAITWRIASLSS
jgi:hypothetical protein